jgi:hypothetical protein
VRIVGTRASGRSGRSSAPAWLGLGLVLAVAGDRAAARGSELPDLVVRAAEEAPLSTTKLRVEVANRGHGPSKATRLTLFYQRAGAVTRRVAPVPALAAGETAWTTVDAGASLAAAARLTLRVDDPPAVAESDELNNDFSVR